MKKHINLIVWACLWVVAAIGLYIWITDSREKEPGQSGQSVKTTIITLTDTVPDTLYYPVPVPVYRDTGTARWRDRPIDTSAILKEYFTKNIYRRILKDDSNAFIAIIDTVTGNRLTAFRFEFQNRRPTTVIQTTYEPAKESITWLSGTVSLFIMPEQTRLMGGLTLTDDRQRSYTVMADPALKSWQAGISLPVWRWHRKVCQRE